MQIGDSDEIAGVPIRRVRDCFRHILSWHRNSFDLGLLQERLAVDKELARAVTQSLIAQEYVKPLDGDSYEFTDKGLELSRASASGKIKRATAESALDGLLKRAEEYNADASKILIVDAIAVFGSFLGDKQELGDLDIAVKWRDRIADGDRAERARTFAERSGRRFSNYVEFLSWSETELFQILKARKRTIKIQDWHAFTRLVAKDPERVNYKIVFGDPERVKAEITLEIENRRK